MQKISFETITKEELKKKLDRQEDFQLVNVLPPIYYNLGFIPGSKKIPVEDLERREKEPSKEKEVVVYCANDECKASRQAAEKLAADGFDVKVYTGGISEWTQSDYPTE